MSKAILTMANSTKLVTPLLPGLAERDLFFSFGRVVPDLSEYDVVSYWMGGAFALKLRTIGLAKTLCSPGSEWLSTVDPVLLGREVFSGVFSDLANFDEKNFIKPAEAKIQSFVAGLYSYDEVEKILGDEKIADDIELQWSSKILDIDLEHRFFIADGKVFSGSPYRVNKVLFNENISWSYFEEAKKFVINVIAELGDNIPPAVVLDV